MKPHGRNDNTAWRTARRRAIRTAGGVCQHCMEPLDPHAEAKTPDATEIDHIVPLSKGGHPYDLTNLRALHRKCHQLITTAMVKGEAVPRRVGWFNGNYYCGGICCPHSQKW